MNDYEQAVSDIDQAINVVDSINGVDPDIEDKIEQASALLSEARELAQAQVMDAEDIAYERANARWGEMGRGGL